MLNTESVVYDFKFLAFKSIILIKIWLTLEMLKHYIKI